MPVLLDRQNLSRPRNRYRGFSAPQHLTVSVTWGQSTQIDVPEGALLHIENVDGSGTLVITARSQSEANFSTSALDISDDQAAPLDLKSFDARVLQAKAQARGADLLDARGATLFQGPFEPGAQIVTRVHQAATVALIAPMNASYLQAGGGSKFTMTVQLPDTAPSESLLPVPLGKVRDEFRINRASAQAYELKKGEFVQVIDVQGQQCSDFMALRSSALEKGFERPIDSTVSRTKARSAYPLPGLHDKFYDQDIRPLLAVRQDTVGRHDTFALACTANGYAERGFPGHINCSDNISEAFAPYGIAKRAAWPAINFFFNSWIDWQAHSIASDEAWSRPGDYVVMEALTDLVCVSTACPDDVDPINGWNPTDVHVRIYSEDTSISHAVVWRAQPEDAGTMTKQTALHPRTSALTKNFHVARDLWVPSHFDATGAVGEYWACREAATLQDMSGLRKYDVVGPDAEELLQHCLTKNVAKLAQFRGLYALMCDDSGTVIDDGTLFRLEPNAFRWCCGSEDSALKLREEAAVRGLKVAVRSLGDAMVSLALQGPKSHEILAACIVTPPAKPSFENVKWFGFTIARLGDTEGPPMMICRTGFTGELGFEIFCDASDALTVWDKLMEIGAPMGLVPMGGDALEMLRIEAGLMISGAEFGPDADALEAGLGFAVDFKKDDFIGRAALERNAGAQRKRLMGLMFQGNEPPSHGDAVFEGRRQVGLITSATYSPTLGKAIAMARLSVEHAEQGTELEVGRLDGHMKRLTCDVVTVPFLDPKREKPRA